MTQSQISFVNKCAVLLVYLIPGSVIHSPTWQTTCLLIPLDAPLLSQVHSQLEMLEQLLRTGCHLVAGRMSTLNNKQRTHIAEALKESSSGKRVSRGFDTGYFRVYFLTHSAISS